MGLFDGFDIAGSIQRGVKALERIAEALEVANRDHAVDVMLRTGSLAPEDAVPLLRATSPVAEGPPL